MLLCSIPPTLISILRLINSIRFDPRFHGYSCWFVNTFYVQDPAHWPFLCIKALVYGLIKANPFHIVSFKAFIILFKTHGNQYLFDFQRFQVFLSATWNISRITLNSCTLNYLTNHLIGPMVSKGLEILQEVEHREERSFGKLRVYLPKYILTQNIQHGHHNYTIITKYHSFFTWEYFTMIISQCNVENHFCNNKNLTMTESPL